MLNPEKFNKDKEDKAEKVGAPSRLAEKAEEHIALQEEFAERAGKPYWQEKAEEKAEGQKTKTETGVRAKILDRIKQKIAEIDREFFSVDWKNEGLRRNVETAVELSEKEKAAYEKVASALSELSRQEDELSKEEFELARERGGVMTETDKEVLEDIVKAKRQVAAERAKLAEFPETALYARMAELRAYQEGLQNGFAETPTVKKNMEWLREEWEFGKPSILEGHTGSWKSRLVIGLSRKLYGRDPEYILCGERVGPPEVFGRMQLRAVGASDEKVLEVNAKIESQLNDWCEKNKLKEDASEDEVKEFARQYGEYNHRIIELFKQQIGVATETYFTPGKFTRAIDQGVPLLNDEFNNMPLNMRMSYKLYYGFKAGRDEVVLQEDSGKAHPIKQGYAFVATANLKDDRHKERFKLDPAELRELDSLHIGYIPPEELYDLCLARLMDKDGNADITKEEALIVLKNLCDAAKEIQTGYEREKGSHFKETNFAKQSIEEAVLDPNSVLKMLEGFNRTKSGDLKTHIEKGLLGFLAKGFPPADKKIVASWFVAKGFFRDKTAQDFGIKGLDDTMLQALKGAAKTEKEAEDQIRPKTFLSLKELASIDPYGVRAEKWKRLGLVFFTNAPKPEGEKGRLKEMPKTIETEFIFPDGRKEKIVLDLEAKLKEWVDLYKEKAVVLPSDFEQIARVLWNSNYEVIKEQTEKLGYDSFLIIPGNLNLPDFHQKMSTGFNPTSESDNFKEGGSFAGVKSPQEGKTRIVLFHEKAAENLSEHPFIKEMLNKKLTDITGLTEQEFEAAIQNNQPIRGKIKVNNQDIIFDGMSVPDYLAIQAYYFKKTGKHLDSATYAWLFGSFSGRRVPGLLWDPGRGELHVYADGPGHRNGYLAPRPAAVFSEFELQHSILNSEFSSEISAEFESPEGGKKEKIAINPEKEFRNWTAFYEKHNILVPADFREQAEDIVRRNRPEMEKTIEQMGYDKIIIVPPNLSPAELHQKMTVGFNQTYESDIFKTEGGFGGVRTQNSDRTRIILVHERGAQNVRDNPIMKEMLDKTLATVSKMAEDKVQELIDTGKPIPLNVKVNGKDFAFSGLDVLGYLVFQRDYFERTGKHLDKWGWSWLTGSSVGRRVPDLFWDPGGGRLDVHAHEPGDQDGLLAPRPAAVFI